MSSGVCVGPVMLGSPMGGMDIEGVAHDHPEKIFKEAVDIKTGPTAAQLEVRWPCTAPPPGDTLRGLRGWLTDTHATTMTL